MCFLGEYLTLKLKTTSFLTPTETVIPSTNDRKKRKDEERSSPMLDIINMIDYLDEDESKCLPEKLKAPHVSRSHADKKWIK